ncbi:MAG: hypothetical protein RSE21_02365, partial [Bacilli bacterium]
KEFNPKNKIEEEGTYTLVVVDSAFNETIITFTIDKTAPTLTLIGESNITLQVGKDKYKEFGAKMTDAVDGEKELKPSYINYSKNNKFIGKVDKIDENKLGQYKVVYTYTDAAGNKAVDSKKHEYIIRVVNVVDTVKPTVTVKNESIGSNNIYKKVSFKLYDQYQIKEASLNGVLKTLTPNVWSDFNDIEVGKFGGKYGENTLIVKDMSNNETVITFTLDNVNPKLNPEYWNKNIEVNSTDKFVCPKAYGTDEISKTENVTVENLRNNVDLKNIGEYKCQYKTTDEAKNTQYNDIFIHVIDTTKPSITVKKESIGSNNIYSNISLLINDNYLLKEIKINGKSLSIKENKEISINNITIGNNGAIDGENTITAIDKYNNEFSLQFILDNQRPKLTLITNGNDVIEAGKDEYIELGALATDNVDKQTIIYPYNIIYLPKKGFGSENYNMKNVDSNLPGKYVLTYSYKDQAGNISKAVQRFVDVIDKTIPTIVTKSNSIGSNNIFSKVSFKINDTYKIKEVKINNVKLNIKSDKEISVDDLTVGKSGVIYGKNTITATDFYKNTFKYEFILDNIAPVITLNGLDNYTIEANKEVFNDLGATITDDYYNGVNPVMASRIIYTNKKLEVEFPEKVDSTRVGTYRLYYSYKDQAMNEVKPFLVRTVNVIEPTYTLTTRLSDDLKNLGYVQPDKTQEDSVEKFKTSMTLTNLPCISKSNGNVCEPVVWRNSKNEAVSYIDEYGYTHSNNSIISNDEVLTAYKAITIEYILSNSMQAEGHSLVSGFRSEKSLTYYYNDPKVIDGFPFQISGAIEEVTAYRVLDSNKKQITKIVNGKTVPIKNDRIVTSNEVFIVDKLDEIPYYVGAFQVFDGKDILGENKDSFYQEFTIYSKSSLDFSKIDKIRIEYFDKDGNRLVDINSNQLLKDEFLDTTGATNSAKMLLSSYATVPGVSEENPHWKGTFANIDGEVTVTKAAITLYLTNGTTQTNEFDVNLTKTLK